MEFPYSRGISLLTTLASLSQCSTSPSRPSVPAAEIERVAVLRSPRSVHTATALHSGLVLFAGGMGANGGGLTSLELFDGATNRIEAIGALTVARLGHTATLLADGRVVIAGGLNGGYESSVEIFDPVTRQVTAAGRMLEGRSGHTATLLASGEILFTGGTGEGFTFLSTAELYDPATRRSRPVGALSVPRESHTATLLRDGRVLITAGHSGRRAAMQVYASAELFDPAKEAFIPTGSLATPRHKHDAIALRDGRVLVIGGADRTDRNFFTTTEVFDARTGRFTPGPAMSNSRYKIVGTSVLLPSGDVLVTSGSQTPELLDVQRMTFREVPGRFPRALLFATASLLPGGDVVIAGGYTDGVASSGDVWRYRQ